MPPADRRRPSAAASGKPSRRTHGAAAVATAAEGTVAGRGESVARAYAQLRELIVWGRLAPGSRIIESDIAARLGVSRTPIRSALHRLQQEGYIVASDGAKEQRLVVAPLTFDDARELFLIVGQLEGLAARQAAELPTPERTALVRQLRQLNDELARAARVAHPDQLRIFELDTAFHRAYVEGGAGPRLRALHDATKPQSERYVRLYVSGLVDEIDKSVTEHERIVRHIEDGNAAEAESAVDTNWRNAAQRFGRVITAFGERGSW